MTGLGVGVRKMGTVFMDWFKVEFSSPGGRIVVVGWIVLFKVSLDETVQFVDGEAVVTFAAITLVFAPPYTKTRHDERTRGVKMRLIVRELFQFVSLDI